MKNSSTPARSCFFPHVCSGTGATMLKVSLALALFAAIQLANAAPCTAPGEPVQWRADYCMLKMETDDEIAASGCIEHESKRRFPNACASNTHFKKMMCERMIRNGTKSGSLDRRMKDRSFKGRTVQNGGVGG